MLAFSVYCIDFSKLFYKTIAIGPGNTLYLLELDLNQFGIPELFFPYEVSKKDEICEAGHVASINHEIFDHFCDPVVCPKTWGC